MAVGRLPVTKADIKMSKDHLKATMKLEKSKIKDHYEAAKIASKEGNKESVAYHQGHLKGHSKDLKERQKYLKKVSKLKAK